MTTKVTGSVLANTAVTAGGYGASTLIPTFTVDAQGRITTAANVTPSIANTQITGLITASQIDTVANTQITGRVTSNQIANTGVTATGYGSASNVPTFNVDLQGRITSASNVAIAISSGSVSGLAASATTDTTNASNISSGTLNNSRLPSTISVTSVTGTSVADTKGDVRNIPQNAQSASYTLVLADAGKHVSTTAAVIVPASIFSTGDAITIYNNSTSSITITCSAVTAYIAGLTPAVTSVTLVARGLCTVLFYGSNACVISGTV